MKALKRQGLLKPIGPMLNVLEGKRNEKYDINTYISYHRRKRQPLALEYAVKDVTDDWTLPIPNMANPNNHPPIGLIFAIFTTEEEINLLDLIGEKVNGTWGYNQEDTWMTPLILIESA